ncbi:response regulator transcription factor [Hydrogenophaga laconesensis]|uniref:DNA-binding response OmpR family regulator/DNA-binding CsgD family transcriptional regulator n=1 Tax=Hydrogenophaga laconesensis TaxID=1805971 RepID=A0ABU1VCD1_9BURK|nr:response regulator transcription factor [Hydrogenophaga laconesensis]MDR7094873.1 DNA-binding response OmpR family regulator/DNA-binding CsgD family transcriptional regulator [Hydrogenophaga laconesensis]
MAYPVEPPPTATALPLTDALVVLIVDDVPDNVAPLHDALDDAGYTVLVALDGESAIRRATQALPDVVLLDAVMPGLDGFEVARRLKAQPATAHIPIIFMTGLTETEHLVAALDAGGADYVTKPIKPREVMARMGVHLRTARHARQGAVERSQARNALDAFGYATITVRERDGRLMWQTPLARDLLRHHCGTEAPTTPPVVLQWLRRHLSEALEQREPPRLALENGPRRLTFRLHQRVGDEVNGEGGDWLIVMQETSDGSVLSALAGAFGLTAREAEVLYWVVKGKINRDIGDILGASPATVKKHLERIHAKLGVETRTAAAAMAINRIRQLHPQFEG